MKWYKVEDYPVGSDEYVLVSTNHTQNRTHTGCIVAKLVEGLCGGRLWDNGLGVRFSASLTDRWCHINLPGD